MRGELRERILRVILNSKENLSKNEISKMAECSRPWVIAFFKQLEKLKLLEGTKIVNKKKLIEYWLSISKKPKDFRNYMVKMPLELLKKTKLLYCLTTYQAENIVQKHLFPSRTDLYVEKEDLEKWHKLFTKNGLFGKGNVKIIISDKNIMFGKRKINGLWMVSVPQLIIDLIKEGGPAQEAGEMLIERI